MTRKAKIWTAAGVLAAGAALAGNAAMPDFTMEHARQCVRHKWVGGNGRMTRFIQAFGRPHPFPAHGAVGGWRVYHEPKGWQGGRRFYVPVVGPSARLECWLGDDGVVRSGELFEERAERAIRSQIGDRIW